MGSRSNSNINKSSFKVISNVNKIKLTQLGAKVTKIESKIYHVKVNAGKTELEYFYNINESGKFFLERMKPFYRNFKVYTEENDAIRAIYEDIKYFENAEKSSNYPKFLEISKEIERLRHEYSEIFLHHNISEETLNKLEEYIKHAKIKVKEMEEKSEEIKIDI